MQLAASVFHTLTRQTTTSPIAVLVLAWVLHRMEEKGKRKTLSPDLENILNKIRRENTRANKILESYKIMHTGLLAWELKTFGQYRFLSSKDAVFNAQLLVFNLMSFLVFK